MAFPILTVLGAGAGIGQSIAGSMGANAAARAANKSAKTSYKVDSMLSRADHFLGAMQNETQYHWDRARVAQLRANEATNRADQAAYGGRVIENAANNLRINTAALEDKFVTEEGLRGSELNINYAYQQAALAQETAEAVAQDMSRINLAGLEARSGTQTLINQSRDLAASLAFDEQKDVMQYQIEKIAATAADAQTKASSYARQGGGSTARVLAMEGVRELGRKFGEMEMRSQNRRATGALFNTTMTDKMASLHAQAAEQSSALSSRVAYNQKRFTADSNLAEKQMKDLQLPTFGLAQRQYGRELESLQLSTKMEMDNALTPYRMQTFMDPMKPIAGISPMSMGPTMKATQSLGSMVGGALMGGIKGAMSGTTKKADGTLRWL